MGLKEQVMNMLSQGLEEELAAFVAVEPRALRALHSRLWDPDPEMKVRASRAIACLAEAHPRLGSEFIRRTFWGLNDESGANASCAIPALGEIGKRSPELMTPFVAPLVAIAADRGLRAAVLAALLTIATARPRLVAPHLSGLEGFLDELDEEERALHDRLATLCEGVH